jgi:hypothetical protein
MPVAVRIRWMDLVGESPESVTLTFDGAALPIDREGRAPLPRHDLESVHLIAAVVTFPHERVVRRDVAYGGVSAARQPPS